MQSYFINIFTISAITTLVIIMKASSKVYYNNQNLQDIWLTSENFKTDTIDEIKKIDNVKNSERLLCLNANVTDAERFIDPNTNKKLSDLVIECNFIETNEINKMYLIEGEEYSKEKKVYGLTIYIFKNAIGDTYDFEAMIKPVTFIMSSIGTFAVVYIVNQFLAKKIKKIDMVSSLKGNE